MFQLELGFSQAPLLCTESLPALPEPPVAPPPIAPAATGPADDLIPWKHGIAIHIVRQTKAKRYLLRLQPDGSARLAIPRRGSRAEALRFLERSEAWLLRQRARWHARHTTRLQPWANGTRLLFRGEEVVLSVETGAGTRVTLQFADQTVRLSHARPDYRTAVQDHLRRLAEEELPPRTFELALQHRINVQRVTVRAQKTRWGSCSSRGTISLNWRIIQAPPAVRDYLVIHELMHRRQMNHSERFWNLVAEACPDYQAAEDWLKQNRLE